MASFFLFMASLQFMPWLVAARLGAMAAGFYAACLTLANVANPLVTGFINAMMPRAALHFSNGNYATVGGLGFFWEMAILASTVGPIVLSVALFSSTLLQAIYGPTFSPYAGLLVILSISFLVRSLGAPPNIGLWALGRADRNALINFGILVVSFVAATALMPYFGVWGAGVGVLAGDMAGVGTRWVCFARVLRAGGKLL